MLLLMAALMLLAGCGGSVEPISDPTPYPADTPVPASTAVPGPTSTPVPPTPTPPPWGLLASLPIEVSAVLAAGPLLNDQRTFTGFGMPKTDSPEEVSPQWEFAVPPGTPALSPVTGYIVRISTLWSNDFSVWLSADGKESRVWEVEHVVGVQVEVGDFVEAGQPIATASVFGGREVALVELGLFKGGETPTHYCPLLYVSGDELSIINADLAKIRKENFDRLSNLGAISIPANDPDGQPCWTDLPVYD